MPDYKSDVGKLDVLTLDGAVAVATHPTDEIWYNDYGLQNADVITQYVRVSAPNLDLSQRSFPRADGVYAESAYRRQNRIKVAGTIKAATRAALELAMDDMRQALSAYGSTMRILWGGAARYYDDCYAVTLDAIFDGRDHYNVDWCPFSVEFTSQQPYARDASRTTNDVSGTASTSPVGFTVANAGSAPTGPIVTVTVVTAGGLLSLTLTNGENGDAMSITRSWSNGDTVEVNGEDRTVKINGVAADFLGVIPMAEAGDNAFLLSMTGAGYAVAISEQHFNRYL